MTTFCFTTGERNEKIISKNVKKNKEIYLFKFNRIYVKRDITCHKKYACKKNKKKKKTKKQKKKRTSDF